MEMEYICTDFSFGARDFEFKFYNKTLGHSLPSAEIVIGCAVTAFELNVIFKLYDT